LQPKKFQRPIKQNPNRINREINVHRVRLVGDDIEPGIYDTSTALAMAQDMEMDLVEISPQADPPVCKIMNYQKYLYDKKKKEKELKAKQLKQVLKEIRFTSQTDDHDFDFKAKHAEKFLQEGAKVKAYVHFRGRAIVFKEQGEILLLKFVERLKEFGNIEQMPLLEGKRMFVYISPKKKNN